MRPSQLRLPWLRDRRHAPALRCHCGRFLRLPPPWRCSCTPPVLPEDLVPGTCYPVASAAGGALVVVEHRGDRVRVRWGERVEEWIEVGTMAGILSEPRPRGRKEFRCDT